VNVEQSIRLLSDLAVSFGTSSAHLFVGFIVGLLSQRFPIGIRFGFLLSNMLTTRPAH